MLRCFKLKCLRKKNLTSFEIKFFHSWRRKIGFNFYIILIHRTELAFPSYENQKEKIFKDFANIISYIFF